MKTPVAARAAILIIEIVTFLVGTAFMAYFISYASVLEPVFGEAPPAHFPVIVYEGDRAKPAPENYRIFPWSEWEKLAPSMPGASLLLPEHSAPVAFTGRAGATFTAAPESESRQSVELRWRTDSGEFEARYLAHARTIEPRYLRTLSNQTLMASAIVAFFFTLMLGKRLRRRWLVRPFSPFSKPQ
jgi:hypothetical protein